MKACLSLPAGWRAAVCGWSKVASVPFEASEPACLLFMWEHLTLFCRRAGSFDQRLGPLPFQPLPLHLHTQPATPPASHPPATHCLCPGFFGFSLKKKKKKKQQAGTTSDSRQLTTQNAIRQELNVYHGAHVSSTDLEARSENLLLLLPLPLDCPSWRSRQDLTVLYWPRRCVRSESADTCGGVST